MTRCAVLDLGSNSFHLLVADVDDSSVLPIRRQREMLHLGRTIERHGAIPPDQQARAVATVERFAEMALRSGAEGLVAVGTEALRGPERIDFVERLSAAAGMPLEILDGDEEARLAYLGARASVDVADEPTLVIDLGGGSLEFAAGSGDRILWSTSLPLGASRLTVMLDPDARGHGGADEDAAVPTAAQRRLQAHVDELLAGKVKQLRKHAPRTVLAVGGTVRALARLLAVRSGRWLPSTVNQASLDPDELAAAVTDLMGVGTTQRARMPGVKSRRADHLHVAALVLESALRGIGGPVARVSDWGLREGVLLERFGRVRIPEGHDLRGHQVGWLRRTFSGDDTHPDHVAEAALQLFDASIGLHGHGPRERELLGHAARLHAIGSALALRRQQEHGAYLIEHAELRGFDPTELAVLITLVRFHPSRGISRRFPPFSSLPGETRESTADLLALLQIADALDTSHDQHTVITRARRYRGSFRIELAREPSAMTQRAVRERSSLFTERFALPVTLATRAT
jgi:exopolyphosphatase/guanosine-5'-triphosphate,3'-diphosphate pyrophosphatase